MAARSTWKGMLKTSLVSIPVRLYSPEERGAAISFHNYHTCDPKHPELGSRASSPKWCPICAKVVPTDEIHRGYEYEKGRHVVVTDDELDSVKSSASGYIEIDTVTEEPVDPLYIDDTYLLVPDGDDPSVHHAYRTFIEGLNDRIALGTVVMREKPNRLAVEKYQHDDGTFGLVAYRLRSAAAVRTFDKVLAPLSLPPLNPHEVDLMKALLDNMIGSFRYEDVRDEYTENLTALLAAKASGKVAPPVLRSTAQTSVKTLADQLAQSLKVQAARKLPTKAGKPLKVAASAKPKTIRRKQA